MPPLRLMPLWFPPCYNRGVRLTSITLADFRNFQRTTVAPAAGVNVLFGDNAQGKTNFIDAVHFLTFLRSSRTTRDREVIRHTRHVSELSASLEGGAGRLTAKMFLTPTKKFVKVDGTPVLKFHEYIGRMPAHFFFPADLSLVKGEPDVRRSAIDYEVLRFAAAAYPVYSRFRQALVQRNALIKDVYPAPSQRPQGRSAEPPVSLDEAKRLLAYWEEVLVADGSRIIARRVGLIAEVEPVYLALTEELGEPSKDLDLKYLSSVGHIIRGTDEKAVADAFKKRLAENQAKERLLRYTTVGPHRDEVAFLIGGKPMRSFASQGQQRTAVLAFKLALCRRARVESGEWPILFLDDALSELDDDRRGRLLDVIGKMGQVFVTVSSAKEMAFIEPFAAKVFRVARGTIAAV